MKTVYLVRHGESEGNVGHFGQSRETPLTDRGRDQAQEIARRAQHLKFDILVSSPYIRALETARAIAKVTNHKIIKQEYFRERRRAIHVVGLPHNHPHSIAEVERWWSTWGEAVPDSDAESYPEIIERANKAWSWLKNRPEDVALVVTHDFTARVILATAVFGDQITPDICRHFIRSFHLGNTGLAGFTYQTEHQPTRWDLLFWNDQSHLAE